MKKEIPGRNIIRRGSASALKIVSMTAAVLLAFACVWAPAGAQTLGNVELSNYAYTGGDYAAIDRAAKSVFYVEDYSADDKVFATGSGFIMFDERLFVTNQHVIENASYLLIVDDDGRQYILDQVIISDKEHDIAILLFPDGKNYRPLPYDTAFDQLVRGQPVLTIGSPKGLPGTVSDGIISAFPKFRNEDLRRIQITAPISHGSSGGCLLNEDLKVIGVTYAGREDGENLGFAIPVFIVEQLYRQWNKKDTVTLGTKKSWDTVGAGLHQRISGAVGKPQAPAGSSEKAAPEPTPTPSQIQSASDTILLDFVWDSGKPGGPGYALTVNGKKLDWNQTAASAARFCNQNGLTMEHFDNDVTKDAYATNLKVITLFDSNNIKGFYIRHPRKSTESYRIEIDFSRDEDPYKLIPVAQELYSSLRLKFGSPTDSLLKADESRDLSDGEINDISAAIREMIQGNYDYRSVWVTFYNVGLTFDRVSSAGRTTNEKNWSYRINIELR